MPVRIYDLAKKLGIESKAVIAKAKELGILGAKVPSSSLDKITAEYLEHQIGGVPEETVEISAPQAPEPILIVKAPEPEPEPEPVPEPESEPESEPEPEPELEPEVDDSAEGEGEASSEAALEADEEEIKEETTYTEANLESVAETQEVQATDEDMTDMVKENVALSTDEIETGKPEEIAGPSVGDKIGFINLPPRMGGREERVRGRTGRTAVGAKAKGKTNGKSATPEISAATPKFIPPKTGELIVLKPPVVVRELAEKLDRKPFQLIADLMDLNVFANVNQAIDEITAQKLCAKYGFRFELEKRERGAGIVHAPKRKIELDTEDNIKDLRPRAPIITIMGHVDHGKTTLLDVIRKSNVVAKESGGITQHIGAYTISIPHPERPKKLEQLTFLDTPGHAAFSSMRARGAHITDIVILVVAANDGLMPQTIEALNHAKAAEVPIIVAVNKIDHPAANPMKVRQQLQDQGLVCEEWGGETIFVDISALKGTGINKLLEMILLQAEIMELKANPNRRAKGNVIESGLEPGGPTATLLVRKGTLKVGNVVICGPHLGKVRALLNQDGKRLKEAGPSYAVKMLGLNGVPNSGTEFNSVENEKSARSLAQERGLAPRIPESGKRSRVTLENLFDTMAEESAKVLKVVVKADTHGSVEAIVESIKGIHSDKVSLEVVHSGVGKISESDVLLTSASNAIILGFHVKMDSSATETAKREQVQVKLYSIIYELIDEVKDAMAGLLDPDLKEVSLGEAEVRKVFDLTRGGKVAGCYITSGRLVRGLIKVHRKSKIIFEGGIQSLRRFQEEVNEVRAGMECGIRIEGFSDFQEGDILACYTTEKTAAQL